MSIALNKSPPRPDSPVAPSRTTEPKAAAAPALQATQPAAPRWARRKEARPEEITDDEVILRTRRLLQHALERGIDSGEFRNFDVDTMLHVVMAPLMLLNVWRYSFDSCCTEPLDPEHYLEVHIDMVLRGLRKSPEAGV